MSTIPVRGNMRMNMKVIGYWTTTAVVAGVLLFGGVMALLHGPEVLVGQFFIHAMHHLGYPLYLLTILGCWKLLGAIALLVPRFPRLKEWVYAGTFFDMTGAAASYAVSGENVGTLILLILAVLTLASWVLRPPSRTLGALSWAWDAHGLRNELIQGRNLEASDREAADRKRGFSPCPRDAQRVVSQKEVELA
jgi:uncharacterized membrane protein YphA (DoxX/SURF4 family)